MIKIGIDIDNVISESYPAYLSKFNSQFNTSIRMEQIREFYFLNRYIEVNRVEKSRKMVEFIDEMVLDETFQMEISAVEDAAKIIKAWSKKHWRIHYVTARPIKMQRVTINWLKKYGFWVKNAKVDLFNGKQGFYNDVPYKKEVADKNKLDIFIEDAIEIARGMDIPVFLLDKPWNQGSVPKNVIRVGFWREIEEKLPKVLRVAPDKS